MIKFDEDRENKERFNAARYCVICGKELKKPEKVDAPDDRDRFDSFSGNPLQYYVKTCPDYSDIFGGDSRIYQSGEEPRDVLNGRNHTRLWWVDIEPSRDV